MHYLFSSPEPNTQGSFSDHNVSVVGRRCCRCSRRCFARFSRGDYNEMAKIHWRYWKIVFFSWTNEPIFIKLGWMFLCMRGTQYVINNQPFNSQKRYYDFVSLCYVIIILLCAKVFIDWNCFSIEQCGPWASYFMIFSKLIHKFF